MKNVIIVDVSKNSAPYEGIIIHKIEDLIGRLGNCDLVAFDTFPYDIYDALDFHEIDAGYDNPCAYYDCMIEIIRYFVKGGDFVKFHIISNNIDDCSRLADEEVFDRYISHTKSYYGARFEYIVPIETKEFGVHGYLSTHFTNLFIKMRDIGKRYDDETDNNFNMA